MKTALLIMAAGIGSRYGGGIKQLEKVDAAGHIIMDYSIHDAIEAGFDSIVFIIRRDIEQEFRTVIGSRIEEVCRPRGVTVSYVFQSGDAIPNGFSVPEGRIRPWGTGQAVLAAEAVIDCPFSVINADDYYGKTAFRILHDWLSQPRDAAEYCLAGFVLKNTLSDHGGVTRGLCSVDAQNFLTDVRETKNIVRTETGAAADGLPIDANALVSMNMWGLSPAFLKLLQDGFVQFFEETVPKDPLGAEFLLPTYIGQLLREKAVSVKVLESPDTWFGVTYKEDKAAVVQSFCSLIEAGVYREELYLDL